jgi:TldD protein
MSSDALRLRELAERIIGRLPQRVDLYADVRVIWRGTERLFFRNCVAERCVGEEDFGVGLRVRLGGQWGFAATNNIKSDCLDRMIKKALASAGSAAYVSRQADSFSAPPVVCAQIYPRIKIDPARVPWETRLELLERVTRGLLNEKLVKIAEAWMEIQRETKLFMATTGSAVFQCSVNCGAGMAAWAMDGDEVQVRSWPANFGGNYQAAGYEFIEQMQLEAHAPRVAAEAVELLEAPLCPAGRRTVILDSSQLALQIHESIGHAVELDRILGYEASYAGTSFVTPAMLGTFQYGSPQVNVTADATLPGGLGSFAYDDEGVAARREPILREGVLVGVLSSCSTAPLIGRESSGAMRADGWQHFPLVRMTNINLEPGDLSAEQLVAETEDGLWLETNRSWSIDDRRLQFQFATEVAREIRGGRLGRLFRNPIYYGTTPQFWRQCDGVASKRDWVLWGVPNCGKGEPVQIARVGHGCAPARFRDVDVGGVK